jgi:hypothetical protein
MNFWTGAKVKSKNGEKQNSREGISQKSINGVDLGLNLIKF